MGSYRLSVSDEVLRERCHSLIFTRYFLAAFAPGERPETDPVQLRAWFAAREPVFRKYTLPSVLGQRHRSFTWFILVDQPLRDLMPVELQTALADARIRLVSSDDAGNPIGSLADLDRLVSTAISHQFESMLDRNVKDPLITVARLDNDDAISFDFLDLLNRLAVAARISGKEKDTIVTFPHGLQYLEDQEFSTYIFNNNHFLGSLHIDPAPVGRRLHALSFNHSHVFSKAPGTVIANTDLPMWVEVIHGKNLINKYRPRVPYRDNYGLEERFSSFYPVNINTPADSVPSEEPNSNIVRTEAVSPSRSAVVAREALEEAIRESIASSGAMKPPVFASVYASILSRLSVSRLFEIGIHEGGSIRMWKQLLGTDARITCMDIKQVACATARGIADSVYEGSQVDVDLLARIGLEEGPFDVIIDDGSHQNPHMILSFEALFGQVTPGGAYVIEDMFTSYWPRYRGGLRKRGSLVEHAKHLIDHLYAPFVSSKYKSHFLKEVIPALEQSEISKEISSIEFFAAGILVINKRRID